MIQERKETVEIITDFSQTCVRCKRLDHGRTHHFYWNEEKNCYTVSEWESPKGWSSVATQVYYGSSSTPTNFWLHLCPDCSTAVLDFIGWKAPA